MSWASTDRCEHLAPTHCWHGRYKETCSPCRVLFFHLQTEKDGKEAELDALLKKTPRDLWCEDLDALDAVRQIHTHFVWRTVMMRCERSHASRGCRD